MRDSTQEHNIVQETSQNYDSPSMLWFFGSEDWMAHPVSQSALLCGDTKRIPQWTSKKFGAMLHG